MGRRYDEACGEARQVHKTKGIMNEHAAHKVDNHHTKEWP